MDEFEETPQRKRRTFEHVLEDLSENFLERKVLKRGHVLRRPKRDYGVDVTMFHYADNGEIEIKDYSGWIYGAKGTPIMIDSGCQFGGAFDFLFLTTDGHR